MCDQPYGQMQAPRVERPPRPSRPPDPPPVSSGAGDRPKPPTASEVLRGQPQAVVERSDRWLWRIYIECGLTEYGSWYRFGHRQAVRKAERELARYRERGERRRTRTVIR